MRRLSLAPPSPSDSNYGAPVSKRSRQQTNKREEIMKQGGIIIDIGRSEILVVRPGCLDSIKYVSKLDSSDPKVEWLSVCAVANEWPDLLDRVEAALDGHDTLGK
jgi:hypothetical protein